MKEVARPYHHGNLREALLGAAEAALEKGGAKHIALRKLSRELGVSHTSPHRHFGHKQALLDALALRGFEKFEKTLHRAVNQDEDDFKIRLTCLGRAYVGFALKHPALLNLMFETKHREDSPPEVIAAAEKMFGNGRTFFAEGQASGKVVQGDPARQSMYFFASLLGLISISTNGKIRGVKVDALIGELVESMVFGFQPRE